MVGKKTRAEEGKRKRGGGMQDDVGILERVPVLIRERKVGVLKTEGKEDKETNIGKNRGKT